MSRCAQHLYIHWPFCSAKCFYCDFVSFVEHDDYQEAYHRILCKEIEQYAQQCNAPSKPPISTLFIGGGTPSLYPLPLMHNLFDVINNNFDTSGIIESTIETNPADITEEKLDAWRSFGINRLSIGVQCLDDTVLQGLNRRQRINDVRRALRIAPKYYDNISVDLILGLPGVTPQAWQAMLEQVVTWPIKHVSVYFLTVHEKTPLHFKIQQGTMQLADDQTMVETYFTTVQFLEHHGFLQYEISNFAQNGYPSLHNQAYWDRKPYQGFGIGASSFDGQQRTIATNNLVTYLQSDSPSGFVVAKTGENLTPDQVVLEHLMLGLRQKRGINLQSMVYFLNNDTMSLLRDTVTDLIHEGLIEENNGNIRLTLQGMVLENDVVVRLL